MMRVNARLLHIHVICDVSKRSKIRMNFAR